MAQRFKIGKRIYTQVALDEIHLKDILMFEAQAADLGLSERWDDIERIYAEVMAMANRPDADEDELEKQVERHPGSRLLTFVTIWVSRRAAGDDLSFADALDFPLSAIEYLPETADRKPGKGKGAKRSPKASGPAESRGEDEVPPETPPT